MKRLPGMVVMVVLLVLSAACCSNGRSFDCERDSIQKIMPTEAHLLSMVDPKQTGNVYEASWQYETIGGVEDARKVFRNAVSKNYELVREDDRGLSYASFDGHDSFYLTLIFQSKAKNSTSVSVVLKSMPD